jgi:uncharacterized protein (TIGR04562 family)
MGLMEFNWDFDTSLLQTMVGGVSSLNAPKLFIKTLDEAYAFLKSYGFDLHNPDQEKKLWYYHRRSLVLLREKILDSEEVIPSQIEDPKKLKDLRNLLLWASTDQEELKDLRRWSCALLRVMHVFVHSEHDLFSFFAEEIQNQILSPIQACVSHESDKVSLKHPFSSDEVVLKGFETKPFKASSSSVIKMLAKQDVVALTVLDKLGVRFITETLTDAFRVALFLAERNIINFAHVMPDQSSNNLYPLNLFIEQIKELLPAQDWGMVINKKDFDAALREKWNLQRKNAILLRKENSFSDSGYKFIKFICRKLINIEIDSKNKFKFFYPFEVQIVDIETHIKNQIGSSSHESYKEKQRQAARKRVFPDLYSDENNKKVSTSA